MKWDICSLSHPGERELNEDCVELVEEEGFLCAVLCDGLGGHEGGELASGCVCASIKKTMEQRDKQLPLEELAVLAVEKAQEELLAEQERLGKTGAMKTTLCLLILSGDDAAAAWVGDSRMYQFRDNHVLCRTKDHSIPQYLVSTGEIKESQIRRHPDRNKLLRVMGNNWDSPRYQMWKTEKPRAGDAFLLCSDGFWDWIDEKKMCFKLRFSKNAENWLQTMEKTVVRTGRGKGMDNYSAVVIKICE